MVASGEVNLREDASKIDGEILDAGERVPVWNKVFVQGAAIFLETMCNGDVPLLEDGSIIPSNLELLRSS